MNKSNRTLISCVALGLNLNTGKSDKIAFSILEEHTEMRQNSNGSRIIRMDNAIFKLFNFKFHYDDDTGAITFVEFLGYKTTEDQVQSLQNHITKLSTKLLNIEELIEKDLQHIEYLVNNPKDYSKIDLDKHEWWK